MKLIWESFKALGKRARINRRTIGYAWKGKDSTYWYMDKLSGENIKGPVCSMDQAMEKVVKGFEKWIETRDVSTKKAYGIKEERPNVIR